MHLGASGIVKILYPKDHFSNHSNDVCTMRNKDKILIKTEIKKTNSACFKGD